MRWRRLFPPIDPESGRAAVKKAVEARSTLTANGRVSLRRHRFAGGHTPMDRFLDEVEATISLGTRQLCCLLNADAASFARAADHLYRTTGTRISAERLRQTVEQEGKHLLACCAKGRLACLWKAGDCTVNGITRLYLGCDGFVASMITESEKKLRRCNARKKRRHLQTKPQPLPPRKPGADQRYKEFKLVTFYDECAEHRLVSVTRHNHHAAGRLMRRDGAACGFFDAQQKLAVIDGGPWIINQIKGQSLPVTAVSLDFYHLAENAHRARRSCFGEDNPAGYLWAQDALHIAKHRGYEPLRDHLVNWRSTLRSPAKRKSADLLINYVTDRREMIDYPRFLKEQWQIGSGPTESQCKLVPRRVKSRGQRWDGDNAEAIMALEAAEQSDLTSVYWQNCSHPWN
jgi:hypothetical protein